MSVSHFHFMRSTRGPPGLYAEITSFSLLRLNNFLPIWSNFHRSHSFRFVLFQDISPAQKIICHEFVHVCSLNVNTLSIWDHSSVEKWGYIFRISPTALKETLNWNGDIETLQLKETNFTQSPSRHLIFTAERKIHLINFKILYEYFHL